ncbi:MAG: DNA repair protein RecO [Acidobacteria bacterium]|nr:DNA repair protein RecO [Acidobacteriota bacterium]
MPLLDSEAIILRASAFAEADKLVSFFTRRLGRLRGVAPRARRSRRRFGAALEPLSHVRLWFYERERHELVTLSESELIEAYWDPRGDYSRTLALHHLVELSERLLPEREPAEKAFRLLLAVLAELKHADSPRIPLNYFQLWMVRLAGWLPTLDSCSRCGKPLADEPAYADPSRGQIVCPRCRRPGMRLLSPAVRQAALQMLALPLPKLSLPAWDEQPAGQLQDLLLDIVEAHGEQKLVTRELLREKA